MSYLDEKANVMNIYFIRNIIFGFSGNPPFWNYTLNNTKMIGLSIKPFVLDYDRILFLQEALRNGSLDKLYEMFTRTIGQTNEGALIESTINWVAYYKIKDINPLIFDNSYGPLKIEKAAYGFNISWNLTNYTNPSLLIELVSDKPLIVAGNNSVNFSVKNDIDFHLIKIYTKSTTGFISFNYTTNDNGKTYNYPNLLIMRRLECKPESICEDSGFIEGRTKIPLIKWFGMTQYKANIDELQAEELIYNAILKVPLDYYLVEVHLFVWQK